MMLLKLVQNAAPGVNHHVISLTGEGTLGPRLRAAGGHLTALNLKGPAESFFALRRIAKIMRDSEPNVAQGWMYHGNLAASLATILSRRRWPVAWGIRCTIDSFEEKWLTKKLVKAGILLSRQPSAIFYNSSAAKLQHEEIGYAKVGKVVANGFELARFVSAPAIRGQMRARLKLGPEQPLIGYVGRMAPIKDLPTFFGAMAKVAQKRPDIAVVAIGRDIPLAHEMLPGSKADLDFLGNRLTLLPEQRDIHDWYQAFDLAALTSAAEGFPNVLGEAMAAGLPCVSTDVGGCREVIADTGRLVPARNSDAFAAAVLELLNISGDSLQNLGERARLRVAEHYSIDSVVRAQEAEWRRLQASEKR